VLFPDNEHLDSRPRKRRKLCGVVESKGGGDIVVDSVASGDNQIINDEQCSSGVIVETLKESFLISLQHDPDGDSVADKENRGGVGGGNSKGRRYTISLILGVKDKETTVEKDTALPTNVVKQAVVTEVLETLSTEASIVLTDAAPPILLPSGSPTSPASPPASMDVDPLHSNLNGAHKHASENTTISDTPHSPVSEGPDHKREDKEIAGPPPIEPIKRVLLSPTDCKGSTFETPPREVVVIPAQPPNPPTRTSHEVSLSPTSRVPAPIPVQKHVEPLSEKSEFVSEVLQRDIGEDNFQFSEEGLGILSDEVDLRDGTKKGWLIQIVQWRKV
jgi:hypothetical protein